MPTSTSVKEYSELQAQVESLKTSIANTQGRLDQLKGESSIEEVKKRLETLQTKLTKTRKTHDAKLAKFQSAYSQLSD
jgi:peptidoglycan hydrolase CwlO-like protein